MFATFLPDDLKQNAINLNSSKSLKIGKDNNTWKIILRRMKKLNKEIESKSTSTTLYG